MPSPEFFLQLVDRDGRPVTSPFRAVKHAHGTVSIPIVEDVLARVGWWRTKARIRQALRESIQALKDEARYAGS